MLRWWKLALVPLVALALFGAAPTFPAQSPERPCVFLDTTYSAPAGRQTSVPAGSDLQGALNSAQPGDTIILQAGATYTGRASAANGHGKSLKRASDVESARSRDTELPD
jgi:hypothetical protein